MAQVGQKLKDGAFGRASHAASGTDRIAFDEGGDDSGALGEGELVHTSQYMLERSSCNVFVDIFQNSLVICRVSQYICK